MPAWAARREGNILLNGLRTLLLTARNAWLILFHDLDVVGVFTMAQSIIAVTSPRSTIPGSCEKQSFRYLDNL